MHWLFLVSLAALAYVYVGYPPLLRLLVRLRGPRTVRKADITPPVSLVISAFNEEDVIASKIENALALDYPADRLEIVVVSDASDDGTDAIVGGYASRGVRLARQQTRRGKTAGLNAAVPRLRGEVVVFSDANAMYEPDALRKLVRNFADPAVGCVTGEARYLEGGSGTADVGERAYWDYEIQIKRYETALGSMVGGDGAIYAIRRSLWQELPEDAINDFLNPLQIVAAGWRGVYEPEAVCHEDTGGAIRTEYRRRVRIVSRSWRAVFLARGALNPFRTGLFAWSVLSHKVLRWLSGVFAVFAIVSTTGSVVDAMVRWPAWTAVAVAVGILVIGTTAAGRQLAGMTAYFVVINAASLVGVLKGSIGRVSGVWSTPREQDGTLAPATGSLVPVGQLLQGVWVVGAIGLVLLFWVTPGERFASILFWGAAIILVYVYVGYPALLAVLDRLIGRSIRKADIEPRVCVFIAANDEGTVIEAKLRNTIALEYSPDRLEIVVASDGSVDATNEIARRFAPRVRLLELSPRRGKIAAINEGMRSVGSEIVIFSDANTFLEPDVVRMLVRNFADPDVGAVSGDVALIGERAALGRSEDLYYRYERWVQHAESKLGSMIGADGALYAIRRELFVAPPTDTILDDMAIPMAVVRAGRRVVYEGAARAFERGSETAREEFARKTRVIAGAMQFIGRHDSAVPWRAPQVIFSLMSHKALRWLSPGFATVAFLTSAILATSSNGYLAAATAQATLILLGLAGCAPALRRISVVALAHYFCLVQAAAAIGFLRGLLGRQSVLWQRFDRMPRQQPVGLQQ